MVAAVVVEEEEVVVKEEEEEEEEKGFILRSEADPDGQHRQHRQPTIPAPMLTLARLLWWSRWQRGRAVKTLSPRVCVYSD